MSALFPKWLKNQHLTRVYIVSHPSQHLILSDFLIFAHLVGVKWFSTIDFICYFFVFSEGGYLVNFPNGLAVLALVFKGQKGNK